ncbi:MAG: hypothetical protein IH892_00475 [Planctomycetes bacterium]|nr:hypothetical protein [Planctomycetota bacterium]
MGANDPLSAVDIELGVFVEITSPIPLVFTQKVGAYARLAQKKQALFGDMRKSL